MRVLAHVHGYPPAHNAGAEWMMHSILRGMVERGHEAQVIATRIGVTGEFEGVTVNARPSRRQVETLHGWADVTMTHLDCTQEAMSAAQRAHTPLVHLVHNHRQLARHRVRRANAALVVFNSEWLQRAVGWTGPQIVCPPPVYADAYRTEPGECILLVNLTEAKGANIFYELAKRLPNRRFIGVRGGYGYQIVPGDIPPNVELIDNTPEMREVYGKARIVLMPSSYESWGRVAIEACASGIPTIAHPTPGLTESLGDAGIFADRADLDAWVRHIEALDDAETYAAQSAKCLRRSDELDPEPYLDRLAEAMQRIAKGERMTAPVAVTERTSPMQVDFLAHMPHYVDHLLPVWQALPAEMRGRFVIRAEHAARASQYGVDVTTYRADYEVRRALVGRPGPVVTASFRDLQKANLTARPQILFEHGAGQSYLPHTDPAYAGGKASRERVILFVVPNEYAAALNRRSFPNVPVAVVGCPKLDRWHAQPPKERDDPPVVAISFHWDGRGFPETRTAYPHFASALSKLASRFRMIGHGHPGIIRQLRPVYEGAGIEVVPDFAAVMERADVYCIDNSSTLFEFASTGRPVVVLNPPWYRRDVHHGLRFWELAGIGVQCDDPADLPAAIEEALENAPERRAAREAAVAKVYPVRDGTAAEKAAAAIMQAVARIESHANKKEVDDHMPVGMRARRSHLADDGRTMIRAGMYFVTSDYRARHLEKAGLAERHPAGPHETPQAGPSEVQMHAGPSETKETPQEPVGGIGVKFVCEECGRDNFTNVGGFRSHVRSHERAKDKVQGLSQDRGE